MSFDLLKREYNTDIVIGVILHDLEEDAGVSIKKIEKRFGKKVAKIVEMVSYNSEILDQKERGLDTYKIIIKAGREAMIVSVADHLENADYYKYAKSKLVKEYLNEKWQMFLKWLPQKFKKSQSIKS